MVVGVNRGITDIFAYLAFIRDEATEETEYIIQTNLG